MPNPGSPQAAKQAQQNMQSAMGPLMSKGMMIGMAGMLVVMLVSLMWRAQIGKALNFAFEPAFGFNGQHPVVTLIIAGLIMITLSTIIRTYMTDFVSQARNQKIQSEFNKEMRQARLENNLYKLKKLQEEQPKIMAKSMETQSQMMKFMPITMIIIMPIYAWVGFFLCDPYYIPSQYHGDLGWFFNMGGLFVTQVGDAFVHTGTVINMPWNITTDLIDRLWILPMWMIIYTMLSLPIGQLENRLVRYFMLKKRLKELDAIEKQS